MARIVPAVRGMYIALTLHLLWTLGAAAVITRRQRIPASAAAWLALVFLLPVAGIPGMNRCPLVPKFAVSNL